MRAQSPIFATILLIAIAVAIVVALYVFSSSYLYQTQTNTQPTPILAPPLITDVYQQDQNVCLVLTNPNPKELNLPSTSVVLTKDNTVVTTAKIGNGVVISPNSSTVICAEVNIPETGEYEVSITGQYPAVTKANLTATGAVSEGTTESGTDTGSTTGTTTLSVTFTHGLTFSEPDSNRYDGILFFGDYNKVMFTVTGPAGTYTLTSPCAETNSCTIDTDSGSCVIITETNTASSSCPFTINGPDVTWEGSVPVYRIFFCSTDTECEADLNTAKNEVTEANSVVLLAASLLSKELDFPSGDYGWRVTFDGNGFEIDAGSYTYAIKLVDVNNVTIRNVYANAASSWYGIYLDLSSAKIIDVNAVGYNGPGIWLSASTATITDSNMYGTGLVGTSYALYLKASRATILNSRAEAKYDAIYVIFSTATFSNVYTHAESTFCSGLRVAESNVLLIDANVQAVNGPALYFEDNASVTLRDVNALSVYTYGVYSNCTVSPCTNALVVDVADGNTYIYAPSNYDWYVNSGTLDVNCVNCGTGYFLVTDFTDAYVSGELNYDDCTCWIKP